MLNELLDLRATLKKRLNEAEEKGLLIENERGTNKYFMAELDKIDAIIE